MRSLYGSVTKSSSVWKCIVTKTICEIGTYGGNKKMLQFLRTWLEGIRPVHLFNSTFQLYKNNEKITKNDFLKTTKTNVCQGWKLHYKVQRFLTKTYSKRRQPPFQPFGVIQVWHFSRFQKFYCPNTLKMKVPGFQ